MYAGDMEHAYARVADGYLWCRCGHSEPYEGDAGFLVAMERLSAHIRRAYTDDEWEEHMKHSKIATFDMRAGVLTVQPKGPKS